MLVYPQVFVQGRSALNGCAKVKVATTSIVPKYPEGDVASVAFGEPHVASLRRVTQCDVEEYRCHTENNNQCHLPLPRSERNVTSPVSDVGPSRVSYVTELSPSDRNTMNYRNSHIRRHYEQIDTRHGGNDLKTSGETPKKLKILQMTKCDYSKAPSRPVSAPPYQQCQVRGARRVVPPSHTRWRHHQDLINSSLSMDNRKTGTEQGWETAEQGRRIQDIGGMGQERGNMGLGRGTMRQGSGCVGEERQSTERESRMIGQGRGTIGQGMGINAHISQKCVGNGQKMSASIGQGRSVSLGQGRAQERLSVREHFSTHGTTRRLFHHRVAKGYEREGWKGQSQHYSEQGPFNEMCPAIENWDQARQKDTWEQVGPKDTSDHFGPKEPWSQSWPKDMGDLGIIKDRSIQASARDMWNQAMPRNVFNEGKVRDGSNQVQYTWDQAGSNDAWAPIKSRDMRNKAMYNEPYHQTGLEYLHYQTRSIDTQEYMKPIETQNPVRPIDACNQVRPMASYDFARPMDTLDRTRPIDTWDKVIHIDAIRPRKVTQSQIRPRNTPNHIRPRSTPNQIRPTNTQDHNGPIKIQEEFRPIDERNYSRPIDTLDQASTGDIRNQVRPIGTQDHVRLLDTHDHDMHINSQHGRIIPSDNVGDKTKPVETLSLYQVKREETLGHAKPQDVCLQDGENYTWNKATPKRTGLERKSTHKDNGAPSSLKDTHVLLDQTTTVEPGDRSTLKHAWDQRSPRSNGRTYDQAISVDIFDAVQVADNEASWDQPVHEDMWIEHVAQVTNDGVDSVVLKSCDGHVFEARSEAEVAVEHAWLQAEKVWLVHRAGFTGARVLKSSDTPDGTDPPAEGRCKVKLDYNGQVLEVDEEDVEKSNPPQYDRVEDMASLRYMNESSVLHTLRQRYGSNLIHTYGGRTQLIINPMHPMSIYSDKVIQMFRGCRAEDMPPHIYACAQIAYRQMLSTRQDQSLLMMGRSGSGKTANARHVLQYLTATAGTVSNVLTVEKLGAIFTLLDAFGNSRTVMNTSATKYTQITSLDFDHAGQIAAASIQVLMLDRSRVVRRAEGEPTFHIFYYLLAGIDSTLRTELQLQNLNEPNLFMTPLQRDRHRIIYGGSSAEDRQRATAMWAKIHHAMNILGIKPGEAKSIYACLAAVYHLGVAGVAKGANNKYQFGRPAAAQRAAAVLGTSVEELSRTIFTAGGQQRGTLRSPSHGEKAGNQEMVLGMEALEGFVVGLYSEAFHAVVSLINRALSSNFRTVSSILVLDMPGFQNPVSCGRNTGASFEDLCHNYAQERLQLLFHDTVFTSQQDLYSQENVECDFEMVTTSPAAMVALIDKPPEQNVVRPDAGEADRRGLLWLLDEEALFPGATEESFVERLYTHHGDSKEKRDSLLKKGQGNPFFVLNHFQGTNPVTYNVKGWLRASRENPVARTVNVFLQDSQKQEMSELFTHVRGPTSIISGSVGGIEGSSSLRRASSIRRSYTTGTAGLKRKSICLQVKFQVDSIIDTLRRTRMHFVHCVLPQNNAGLCDLRSALSPKPGASQDDIVINVPLVRSQLRGSEIVDAIRIHRQGFPEHMLFGEFRRRFEILVPPENRPTAAITDEKLAVEKLTTFIDIDKSSFRLGLSQVFFRAGGLAQLEDARDEKITGTIVALQAYCRGHLGRQNLKKLKLQHMAVTCIQRNVRKFMAIRGWSWWRLYTKVQPLLNVHRTEEELRDREIELEQLKSKTEKLDREKNEYKHSVEKLETKLSEMTADYAEEHTTSNQATELLEAEQTQRMRLEKELKEIQGKYAALQRRHETTEMDLVQAQLIVASLDGEMDDDDDLDGDSIYRQKYERSRREMDMMKKKQEQQQEELADQYAVTKKQLDRKLADSVTECEEQRRMVGNLKRKSQRQLAELQDMKLHLEEQVARNADLEKKQRKFDAEMQKLQEALKTERAQREKLQRERDQLTTDRFTLEQQLKNVQMDYELASDKVGRLDRELTDMASLSRDDKELMTLKRVKGELEAKVTDQEEELDDQAGTIQQLEQAKLRLEMAQEKLRQQHTKELEEKEQELEDNRASNQKKLRALEVQVEEEYAERQTAQKEKREMGRKMQNLAEQESPANRETERRLRRDLKRTRALLADAQMMLDRQKDGQASRASLKQLRNQLEDAEYSMSVAIKARKGLELEATDLQSQVDDLTKAKHEMEEKHLAGNRSLAELQSKLEENEEDMADIMKKFKAAVQQQSVDQITVQDQSAQIEQLTLERESLRETLSGLQTNLEYMQSSMIDKQASARLEAKIRDLESRLDLEQTSRRRADVQVTRLKETVEHLTSDKEKYSESESQSAELMKRLQRQLRDLREEHSDATRKEAEAIQRKQSLEAKIETMETDYEQVQSDLRLAFKRIADLQAVIEDGMDSEDDEDEDDSMPLSDEETDESDLDVDGYLEQASSVGKLSPSAGKRVSASSLQSPDHHTANTDYLHEGR